MVDYIRNPPRYRALLVHRSHSSAPGRSAVSVMWAARTTGILSPIFIAALDRGINLIDTAAPYGYGSPKDRG